jgi:4-hydroxythreonine-4-phosphate dehydrogenase
MSPRPIGISIGDVTGIGPEVTLKALAEERKDSGSYVLIGDIPYLEGLRTRLGVDLAWEIYHPRAIPSAGRVYVFQPAKESLPKVLAAGAAPAARAAAEWVRVAAQMCLAGELSGMVTAPVNKEAIVRAGIPFVGQTEMLSEVANTVRTAMMLLGKDDRERWLRVILATTHVPIKDVAQKLTREKVELAIELAAESCRLLGLPRQRVAVCGLNPHAGEGGKMGMEEITTITPGVQRCRERGLDAHGPFSADALFYYVYRGDYDAVVAMYHDQGLVPLKMVAFEHGINWTLGLPFIRTSPDHGTAYDIAGQGKANPSSMIAAIELAKKLAGRRA